MARRQLPLPDGIAPSRRPPPPTPVYDDEAPPPPVPSRPTPGRPTPSVPAPSGRPMPKPPTMRPPTPPEDEQTYDEGEPGEIYDEAEIGKEEEEEQETYDDMEVGEAAEFQQEEYADCNVEEEEEEEEQQSYDEFGGVAQDTYEVEPEQEEYQECDVGPAVSDELYQVADDSPPPPPVAAAPALPPPRPRQRKDDDAAPPPPRQVEKKVNKPPGPGMPAIGMGDILSIKDRLKKVSVPKSEPPEKKEPKMYTDSNELKAKFDFFKQKEKEDGSDSDDSKKQEFILRPTQTNKPLPLKSNKELPHVPLKPLKPSVQSRSIPERLEEKNVVNTGNFLSQVKLKHVPRPPDTSDQSGSVSNGTVIKPPRQESSPQTKPPETEISAPNVRRKPEREPPTRPVPVPRPSEKNSFLHAYLQQHPEVSNQKLTPRLNTSDSLPPLPNSTSSKAERPPPPPPVSEIPSKDLPPTPDLPPSRGRDGYSKVNIEQNHHHEEEDDTQDIYDDALSFEDPLKNETWYFGEIDRMVGNDKLKKLGVNGSYLLRKSTKGGDKQPYTLMVMYKGHIYNLKIRERNDGRMALGEEKPDEMTFKSVVDLIKHHQENDVILVHKDGKQDTTMLLRSPQK